MADDTPRNKKSIGCATSKGVEASGSYGLEKQELQSYRTVDVDRERAHRYLIREALIWRWYHASVRMDAHYTPEPPICTKTTLRLGQGIASGGVPA